MVSPITTTIAIVDDDRSICTSLSRLLRLAHFQAIAYSSAEAFLAHEPRPPFGCLVLDIRLGGMSGLELLAQLAAEAPPPPVIVVTAVDEPALRAKAQALGCAGFFSKSTPGSGIIAAIRGACGSEARPGHA